MLTIYGVTKGHLEERQHIAPRSLIRLTDPEDWEVDYVRKTCGNIDGSDLRVAMDDDEPARFEEHGAYSLLVVDMPVPGTATGRRTRTAPTRSPSSRRPTAASSPPRASTSPRLTASTTSQRKVTIVDGKSRLRLRPAPEHGGLPISATCAPSRRRRAELVSGLDRTTQRTRVSDLVALHGLEADIVYLETSLSGNRAVLERAARSPRILADKVDETLFDDILIEIRQADEMARTYRQLITSTRELFSSVMDNGLNATMKFLAAVTIVLAIPTMIAGFYGMNVDSAGMPFADSPFGFLIVAALSVIVCVIVVRVLKKRDLL